MDSMQREAWVRIPDLIDMLLLYVMNVQIGLHSWKRVPKGATVKAGS